MPLEDCLCREGAAAAGVTDLSWWCWMFGCQTCVREHHICGDTKRTAPACSCPTDAEIRAAIHHSHQQLTGGNNQ